MDGFVFLGSAPVDMYWVYSLPNFLFELLTVGFFVAFSLVGLLPTRSWTRRLHVERSHNDIVGLYLAAIAVLYGVTLGLLAVGAWTTYTDTEATVAHEASILSGLYRSVGDLQEPMRSLLQNDLRDYARRVIDVGWPEQRRGIQPVENIVLLDKFQSDFRSFAPATDGQMVLATNISREFDALDEARSVRMDSVLHELPSPLWTLVFIGALIAISVTWFFHMESMKMHVWMTVLFSALIGLMIFMVAALDNPYRGKISVGPESFERVYSRMMK
jgi:hypothetical protein